MNRTEHNPEAMLDAAIAGIHDEPIDPQVVEEAGRRAWSRIVAKAEEEQAAEATAPRVEHIRNCADFQALIPDYRAGKLTLARRMLLEDHIHECVACRRVLHPETGMKPAAKVVEMPRRAWTPARWAAAAMVVIGVGSTIWFGYDRFGPAPAGSRATLLAADGAVYKLAGTNLVQVANGASFSEGDRLRTAGGSHAMVRLLDGSMVEVAERAEFSITATRRDTTMFLNRGRIIVQAAKRSRGHLYISAGDTRVAVTGTVFSVNRGIAGLRVSVIEGAVEVRNRGNDTLLRAGDQTVTHPSIARIPVQDEIAWSRNFDQYLALLKQFVDLKEKFETVRMPGMRFGSRLLDSVPEGTTIYISLPNASRAMADVERIITDQAAQSPEMQQFMKQQFPQFEQVTQMVTRLGEYLGEEIVFAGQSCKGFCGVFVADVNKPGLREFITNEVGKIDGGKAAQRLRIVEGANLAGLTDSREPVILFAGNRVIVGEQRALLQAAVRGGSTFAQSPFGQAISDVYKRGTGVLVAADLEKMFAREMAASGQQGRTAFARFGIDQVKYFIAEQRSFDNKTEYSASINFSPARRGVASWLAEPGPMGSLSFVSPGAQFAASFVVRKPEQMLEDAIALGSGRSQHDFDEIQNAIGVDVRKDVVAALGGEVTFALDGPMLPTPAWKLIVEVNDPERLQAAIQKLVAAANQELGHRGQTKIELTTAESVQGPNQGLGWGRTQKFLSHSLKIGAGFVPEVHYAFVDGYLVAAPSQSLLLRSVGDRMSGVMLPRSRQFTRLLPRDQRANFSAMVYQNAGELLSLIAKSAGPVSGVSPEQQKRVEEIAGKVEPMLVCAYGEPDRIEIASQGSALNLLTQSFAGQLLGGASKSRGTRNGQNAYR